MMNTQGAFAIILNEHKNRVLLLKRKDFPVWDLPGGRVEKEESPGECACRESTEETGYIIEIYKKIGEYHRIHFSDIQHVFLGRIFGGQEIKQGKETRKIKWFKFNRLPCFMVPHRKKQIKDFVLGRCDTIGILEDSKFLVGLLKLMKK